MPACRRCHRRAGAVARIEAGGTHYTVLGTPLLDVAGRPIGELRILRSSESARQRINALGRDIIVAWLIAVLAGLWLTYSLARRILRPVKELDRGASEVARGNYDYRIPVEDPDVGTRDELGRLAAVFNAMCASIQDGRQELIRQERIATIGRLSTSIVHDLRNPLAAIYGGAEMLIDGELTTAQVQRLAGNIYRSSRRMQELLQELVDTGRGRSISTEVCRLRDIVSAACDVFSPTAEAQSVTVQVDVPDGIELPLERARMERVFLNLIDNSLGVMPTGRHTEHHRKNRSVIGDGKSAGYRPRDSVADPRASVPTFCKRGEEERNRPGTGLFAPDGSGSWRANCGPIRTPGRAPAFSFNCRCDWPISPGPTPTPTCSRAPTARAAWQKPNKRCRPLPRQ